MSNTLKITCPIRGELNVNEKEKDNITLTEEYQRVMCVKFLLERGYPKDLFDFEKDVMKVGNAGRNSVRADIVIYKDNTKQNIFLIAEIKRDNKDITDAVHYQLKPSCLANNTEYGIYFDGIENIIFKGNDFETKYSLLKLPKYNFNWENDLLIFDKLQKIENITGILDKINQIFHNSGLTKEKRYRELFKIVLSKYFDEKDKKGTDKSLDFQISQNTTNNIKKLYKKSLSYYNNIENDELDLKDETIISIVQTLQDWTFIDSKQDIMQVFFMNFAPYFLKTELDQFYTPIEIVEFITSLLEIKNTTKIIDPAGGSGDFLVGCLKKNSNVSESVYYFDISPEAKEVAMLNMILNGDGRSNLKVLDSIENYNKGNGNFDLVITNPPFGSKTIFKNEKILQNYELYKKYNYKQLGVLFIERAMNLLKDDGILCIVLPNGYLTNPNDKGIREYLQKYRIVAYISLPEGAFKGADTGVKTGILIVRKENINKNYKFFTAVAENIGFDYKAKDLKKLYQKDKTNGNFILDKNNKKISLTDLNNIAERFRKFINDTNISGFEKENSNLIYDYITYDDYNKDLILRPETNTKLYIDTINKIKNTNYATLKDAKITNKNSLEKDLSKEYSYIDISNIEKGNYLLNNRLLGWELPNRAKQSVNKYDICISKLKGSLEKFCMILNDNTDNIVLTNGCYKITINDEKTRLSFYKFLFSNDYITQMSCLATGSIMLDVKDNDLKEKIVFPLLNEKELTEMQEFLKQQEFFIKLRNNM